MKTISVVRTFIPALAGSVLLVGCVSMAPSYQRPSAPIAPEWPIRLNAAGQGSTAPVDMQWQELFADPALKQLIEQALDHNRDLRIATLNIERARAQYRIQRSELFPTVSVGAAGSSGRTPASISPTSTAVVGHAYSLDVGITAYELDLFGRVRSLKDQALQQYLATEAAQGSARISLITGVAAAYLQLAADGEQLSLARRTMASRQEAYDLQRQLREIGNASDLALRQAEAELEGARDQMLMYENAVTADRNALELLVGRPLPADFQPSATLEDMLAAQDLPAGIPSDLLRRRPDIVAAEHALMAANANIGAARAAFFPTIQLTASFGRASDSLSSLFDGGNRAWAFAPQITLPIFAGGRLQAGLDTAKVDREIAVADYERSIQSAFREVADALGQRATLDGRLSAQQRRVESAQQAYKLVKQRYDNGVSSYLEVLDAQRTLYAAQQNRIGIRLARQTNMVTLYKSLGGDWSSRDLESNADGRPVVASRNANGRQHTLSEQ